MYKNLTITSILGLVAIILGAFAAHKLKSILTFDEMQSFETAVRYQMYHVLVLLFVNMFSGFSVKQKNIISYILFAGILCFSGSIYGIHLLNISAKSIWFITPFGGLLFIIAWIFLIINYSKKITKKQ